MSLSKPEPFDTKQLPVTTHVDGIPMALPTPPNEKIPVPPVADALPPSFYHDFMSDYAQSQLPNPIRKVIPLSKIPGMLSLFAGIPSDETRTIKSITVEVSPPSDPTKTIPLELSGQQLIDALQYGDVAGTTYFISWLKGLQLRFHRREIESGWELSVGSGSQDLLTKAFTCILNARDTILVEAPVYGGVTPVLKMIGCNIVEVATDVDGIRSDALETILRAWPKGKPHPKALYTIPYGCNPTGASATLERRLAVLKLAHDFNFLVMEDDPYFFLYYGAAPKVPSYFQLEAEVPSPVGRVLRFDSFSKVISAGMRIGFVSGPKPLVRAMNLMTSATSLQPNNLAQGVCYKLVEQWGYDGFEQHTQRVAATYKRKRDLFSLAMHKHLTGLAEWNTPDAGMFFWFKLLHLPPCDGAPEGDSEDIIMGRALEQKVLALPGASFYAVNRKSAYVRVSFSVLAEDLFDEAIRRLAEIARSVKAESKKLD